MVRLAAAGAVFGAIGPILHRIAYGRGRHFADGSGVLERIAWIFPCWILCLGFPRADRDHPRILRQAFIVMLVANMAVFAVATLVAHALVRRLW